MTSLKLIAAVTLLLPSLALAGGVKKHNDVPAVFGTAKTFYVESVSGSLDRPGLNSADAQVINDVQAAILRWHRYDLAPHRDKADLIFVLRKAPPAAADQQPGLRGGSTPGGQSTTRTPGQSAQPDSLGASSEAATAVPEGDSVRVYTLNEKGKLNGPILTREIPNGLDSPSPLILEQLKLAIDQTFPLPAAADPAAIQ